MLRCFASICALGIVLGGWWASPCAAGKFNATLSVGDAAPDWKNLPGIDGNEYALADYREAELVVLVFTCNHCPVARAYEDRLIGLQRDFAKKGVQFVAISCNNSDADRMPAMIERAKARGFPYPYLHDEAQASARAYGATVTPEVFVLTPDRTIGYMGAIDDSWDKPSRVEHHYLRDAIEALLAGRSPAAAETRPRGCGIQFE